MADLSSYFSDAMFFDKNVYKPEVRRGNDGFYRWCCTLDQYHDRKMYRFLFRFIAIFSLCGLVMGFLYASVPADLLRKDFSQYQNLLWRQRLIYSVLGYAVFFAGGLVIIGLVRLLEKGPSQYWYRMNDEFVQIKPSGKGSGINAFDEVRRAELYPAVSEVRLYSRWGKCPVLVRQEDYELVKDHILAHIPENAKVETLQP